MPIEYLFDGCCKHGATTSQYCEECDREQEARAVRKYTAIYNDEWMVSSIKYSLTKMLRLEKRNDETVSDMLEKAGIADSTVFLFIGHPPMQGEGEG